MFATIRGFFVYAGVASKYVKLCVRLGVPPDVMSEEEAQQGLLNMYSKKELAKIGFDLAICSFSARIAYNSTHSGSYGSQVNKLNEIFLLVADASYLAALEKTHFYSPSQRKILDDSRMELDKAHERFALCKSEPFSYGYTS